MCDVGLHKDTEDSYCDLNPQLVPSYNNGRISQIFYSVVVWTIDSCTMCYHPSQLTSQ